MEANQIPFCARKAISPLSALLPSSALEASASLHMSGKPLKERQDDHSDTLSEPDPPRATGQGAAPQSVHEQSDVAANAKTSRLLKEMQNHFKKKKKSLLFGACSGVFAPLLRRILWLTPPSSFKLSRRVPVDVVSVVYRTLTCAGYTQSAVNSL